MAAIGRLASHKNIYRPNPPFSSAASYPDGVHFDLHLAGRAQAAEIATLRKANPYTIVLTSINACETVRQDLPDDFYLTNVTRPPSTKGERLAT
jgi:hypothetical protein